MINKPLQLVYLSCIYLVLRLSKKVGEELK